MEVIPAILGRTGQEVLDQIKIIRGMTGIAHWDIMDGRFVKEQTPLPSGELIDTTLQYDLHLMVRRPFEIVMRFPQSNLRYIFLHAEISKIDLNSTLQHCLANGLIGGIALNPRTNVKIIERYSTAIKAVLLMAVKPGDSGRPFDKHVISKIAEIKHRWPTMKIHVDGGISAENIQNISQADGAVAHSAVFGQTSAHEAYAELTKLTRT